MKNIFLAILLIGLFNVSIAQEFKGSSGKATTYLSAGKLDKAKGEIDTAIGIEKQASKSKTWNVRGKVYLALSRAEGTFGKLEYVQEAGEAFKKVLEMDKEGSLYYLEANDTVTNYYSNAINTGVNDYYTKEKFTEALVLFENANAIQVRDSLALYLIASTALQIENYDRAISAYTEMKDYNFAGKDTYQNLIFIYRVKKEDNDAALKVIQEAKEKFPEETVFVREEISIMVQENRLEEAKNGMEAQLKDDPNNLSYNVSLGIIYDNMAGDAAEQGKKEEAEMLYAKAVEKYEKSVEIDPENYAANKNLASFYVTKANNKYKKATDKMDYKAYLKYGKKHEEERDATYRKGLPYLLKAAEIKNNDPLVLEELKQMYLTLKMNDEAIKVQDKIDAMN